MQCGCACSCMCLEARDSSASDLVMELDVGLGAVMREGDVEAQGAAALQLFPGGGDLDVTEGWGEPLPQVAVRCWLVQAPAVGLVLRHFKVQGLSLHSKIRQNPTVVMNWLHTQVHTELVINW